MPPLQSTLEVEAGQSFVLWQVPQLTEPGLGLHWGAGVEVGVGVAVAPPPPPPPPPAPEVGVRES